MIHMEILIKEKLDTSWTDWFEDMKICQGGPDGTLLAGDVPDQAAVYGMISRLSGLRLSLISVTCDAIPNQRPPP